MDGANFSPTWATISRGTGIQIELRYATTENFTHKRVYRSGRCRLRPAAATALVAAQRELRARGLGLKVWDCYRPLSVQKVFWSLVPDERYVADPAKGSRHNRGAAVDVTLVDARGRELPMPTKFDDFSERAHRDFAALPEDARRNRALLEDVMTRHGFTGLPTEWWHFDLNGWEAYEIPNE